jgi:hypothetical protein
MKKRIYGWDNSIVPVRYLNKLSTTIRNQSDYDRMKEQEFGMTKIEYQLKNNIWVAPEGYFVQKIKSKKKPK